MKVKVMFGLGLLAPFLFKSLNAQDNNQQIMVKYLLVAEDLANRYYYDSSVIYYDSALQIANQTGDPNRVAHVSCLKGNALRNAGKTGEALDALQEARQKAVDYKIDSICAMADIGIGHIYEKKGKLDSAEFFYNHALSDFRKMSDSIGVGKALYNLSMFYQTKVDYERSLEYALECKRIFKRFDKPLLYCRSLLNMGNIFQFLEEYDTALSCYEQGKQIAIELNDSRRAALFANNKAVIYYYQDKLDEAKKELLNAIEFNEKIGDKKELSILYRNVSVILKNLEKSDEAITYAEKSLLYARQLKNVELISDALLNLGVHHKQKGNYPKAEEYYLEGVNIAEQYNMKWEMQAAYENIVSLYDTMGDMDKAFKYLQKYVTISDSITNEEKIKAREKYKAEYELLHYKDLNHIKELEKKKIRFERNLSYGIGASIIILLFVVVFFLRMRARKNRIIAAQKIQKLEDEKKLMAAQSVMIGQEKERERIARELHDGIGVLLSTASIHFSSVEAKADRETEEMLKKANKLLKEAGKEVRQISHNMMPGVLAKFGLREAIEDLFEEVEDAGNITVELLVDCDHGKRLPENMEIMIYRIVQEMLNNTLKYAQADKIIFRIERSEENIKMEYTDNGIGFEEDKIPHGKNLGLSGIRSRVEYLGGKVQLISKPKEGTTFSVSIPLPGHIN